MREVVGIVLMAVFTAFMAIFAIGAVVINLFDREREENGAEIRKAGEESDESELFRSFQRSEDVYGSESEKRKLFSEVENCSEVRLQERF